MKILAKDNLWNKAFRSKLCCFSNSAISFGVSLLTRVCAAEMKVRYPEIWLEIQRFFGLKYCLVFMSGTKQDLTFQCKHERRHRAQFSCPPSLGNRFFVSIRARSRRMHIPDALGNRMGSSR